MACTPPLRRSAANVPCGSRPRAATRGSAGRTGLAARYGDHAARPSADGGRTERIEGTRDCLLHFREPIAGRIAAGNILENATLCPRLTVRNCRMLKQNCGRSILVTTPAKILIENNYFRSAGAAILIEGDTDLWFESGAVCDVTIRNQPLRGLLHLGKQHHRRPLGLGRSGHLGLALLPAAGRRCEGLPSQYPHRGEHLPPFRLRRPVRPFGRGAGVQPQPPRTHPNLRTLLPPLQPLSGRMPQGADRAQQLRARFSGTQHRHRTHAPLGNCPARQPAP